MKAETLIIGLDEAGRGALAGPVIAAAVAVANDDRLLRHPLIRDSKTLNSKTREASFDYLQELPIAFAVGCAGAREIDRFNILRATGLAMKRAIKKLLSRLLLEEWQRLVFLVDGKPIGTLGVDCQFCVGGDRTHPVISAASIVAKVTRDRLMIRYDRKFPAYGFAQNKGYATPGHLKALRLLGPCPIHRFSYDPVVRGWRPALSKIYLSRGTL